MKNIYLLSFVVLFFVACSNNHSSEKNNATENNEQPAKSSESSDNESVNKFIKYPFESGIVTYKNDMMGMTTNMTLYFKDFGKTECTEATVNMMGNTNTTRSLLKDGYLYSFSMKQKTGIKTKLENNESMNKIDLANFDAAEFTQNGGKKEGTEEILGKKCQVFSISQDNAKTKIWIWDNLLMKMTAEQNGMSVTREAIKIEKTSNFPEGIFEIPKDIIITEEKNINMDSPQSDTDFVDKNAAG